MAPLPPTLVQDEAPGVVASPARIDAWLAVARTGDRFVYATRLALPVASAGAKRMRDLAERGIVALTQKRSDLDRAMFCYTAQRTAMPSPLTRPDRATLSVPTPAMQPDEVAAVNALMPVLERFAGTGRPCPTNPQLAERSGLSRPAVESALSAMVAAHLIRVSGVAAPTCRRVTILATGATTGWAA